MEKDGLVRSRVGFCLLIVVLALLVFFFSTPLLLGVLLFLLVFGAAMGLLLRLDAKRLKVDFSVHAGGREGDAIPLILTVEKKGRLFVSQSILVELEVKNTMFGSSSTQVFLLTLAGKESRYETSAVAEQCGEACISCRRAEVRDLLKLFRRRIEAFPEIRTVLFPHETKLELILSRMTVGASKTDGLMQNRKGNDPSEIFDIREYVPGDDVRAIHWKLSGKTGTLILREASDPSHYDAVLLADLGLAREGQPLSDLERNGAAALCVSVAEELLRQGMAFCMAIPTPSGLELCEVRSEQDLERALSEWLSIQIRPESGDGLEFFLSEHLEQHFTRLLIVSAGWYVRDVSSLENQIGVTVISAVDAPNAVYASMGSSCQVAELPADPSRKETFRVIC